MNLRSKLKAADYNIGLWDALIDALAEADEALGTLEVAVNDKVEDKGATAFIQRTRAAIAERLKEFLK